MNKYFASFVRVLLRTLGILVLMEIGLRLDVPRLFSLQEISNAFSLQKKNAYRIVCLGDSYLGTDEDTADLIPNLLENILNSKNIGTRFTVVNMKRLGTTTAMVADTLDNTLNQYKPDMVVTLLGISEGDILRPTHNSLSLAKVSRLYNLLESTYYGFTDDERKTFHIADIRNSLYCRLISLYEKYAHGSGMTTCDGINPYNQDAYVGLETLYMNEGRYRDAENILRKATGCKPANETSCIKLAQLYRDRKEYAKAEEMLNRALCINPVCDKAFSVMGQIAMDIGESGEAEEFFNKAIKLNPCEESYYELGECYLRCKEYRKAETILKKALEIHPQSDRIYCLLGRLYLSPSSAYFNAPEAEHYFLKAIRLDRQQWIAYVHLGWIYHFREQDQKAMGMLEKAHEMSPGNGEIYFVQSKLYSDIGDDRKAEKCMQQAIRFSPGNPYAIKELTTMHDCRLIEEKYRKIFQAAPRDAKNYISLGEYYYRIDKFKQSEKYLTKALTLAPDIVVIYWDLAKVYGKGQYDFSRAMDVIKKAIDLFPNIAENYVKQGELYQLMHDYARAEKSFKHAIAVNPGYYWGYICLANLYLEYNQNNKAEDITRVGMKHCEVNGMTGYSPVVAENYCRIKRILDRRGVRLVCVQYPLCDVKTLKNIFKEADKVIFVDNNEAFRKIITRDNYNEFFSDRNCGDFGHGKRKANEIIARNIADAILAEVFNVRVSTVSK